MINEKQPFVYKICPNCETKLIVLRYGYICPKCNYEHYTFKKSGISCGEFPIDVAEEDGEIVWRSCDYRIDDPEVHDCPFCDSKGTVLLYEHVDTMIKDGTCSKCGKKITSLDF